MRASLLRTAGCLLLATVSLMPGPAQADTTEVKHTTEVSVKDGEHKEGAAPVRHKSPAEELTDLKFDLGIYTLIVFGGLLLVLWAFAWKPMLEGLKKREGFLVEQRQSAATDRAEAEALLAQVKAQLAQSHNEARGILDEARKDAEALRTRLDAESRAALQADRERMLREIEVARDQALADLYNRSVELATLVSAKAVRRQISSDDHRRLVDEALAELDTAARTGAFAGSDGGRG